jgi:IS30 family transposase
MSTSYHRLSFKSRVAIYYLYKQGCSQREIAHQLEVSPSTVCRELQRNRAGKLYFPEVAQHKAQSRCFKKVRKLDQSPALKRAVLCALRKQWSPEQISAYLKIKYDSVAMQFEPPRVSRRLVGLSQAATAA